MSQPDLALPDLALVVIARNEAPRITRLLGSMRPWVDHMLVMDTGSQDDTVALARAAGAEVRQMPWPDDFALARNATLDACPARWHIVLDADEWLIEGGAALRDIARTPPDHVGAVQLLDQFEAADGQRQTESTWLSRLLPGTVRYRGRIHEQPQHQLPVRRLPVRIGHDGYLGAARARKQGRNQALLEAALASAPGDAYLWYQYGKDLGVQDLHQQAEAAYARVEALADAQVNERLRGQAWWRDLVVRRLFGLKCLGRHEDGLAYADSQMARCAELPDFYFALGDLLLDFAASRPELAGELLPMMEAAWQRCLEIGERPDLSGSVAGRGSHLAAHNLALVLDATGRADEAMAMRQRYQQPSEVGNGQAELVRQIPTSHPAAG